MLLTFYKFGTSKIKNNLRKALESYVANYIVQETQKKESLFGVKQMTTTDNRITLVNIRFNRNAYKNLSKKKLDALSDTASNFFRFIQAFGNKLKLRNFINIWMVEDRVQDLNSATCGIFQIYFYDNLFNPDKNSKIQNRKRLNKKTIETLLNEIFVLDDQETNEAIIRQYANENNITGT